MLHATAERLLNKLMSGLSITNCELNYPMLEVRLFSKKNTTGPNRRMTNNAPRKAVNGRKRLPPAEREQQILTTAMRFVAEHGFHADTQELARRAGISHGLLFRYFGTKETMVERVYEANFISRWHQEWEDLLKDRSLALETRLSTFYKSYLAEIDGYEWIRISLYAGLNGHDLTTRYIQTLIERVLTVIAEEVCHVKNVEIDTNRDIYLELAWHIHSSIIYLLIRRYVFEVKTVSDNASIVDTIVRNFVYGLGAPTPESNPSRK